jgi:hypothetical protein
MSSSTKNLYYCSMDRKCRLAKLLFNIVYALPPFFTKKTFIVKQKIISLNFIFNQRWQSIVENRYGQVIWTRQGKS